MEELSDFDKGQVVVAVELGKSVSEVAQMVGCSRAAVVHTYRQWCEEGQRLRAGRPGLIDPRALMEQLEGEEEAPTEEEDVKSEENAEKREPAEGE